MEGKYSKDKLQNNFSKLLEIPSDLTLDLPKLTLIGNVQLIIENHRGLIEFTAEKTVINTSRWPITLNGRNLMVRSIMVDELMIEGVIDSIRFWLRGGGVLINRGWSYLTGYLNIEVTGEDLEAFINMAISRGIFLWEIRRVNERTLLARVRISGFFGLRHISRRTRCRMRIKSRRGLPFLAVKIRKRKMLALGSLLFLMILYGLASFVWVVSVTGTNQLDPELILEVANQHGLRVGVLRSQLDKSLIEHQLKEDFPAASFINLQIKGTTVNIEIVEKVLPPEIETEKQSAHIVARRDGMIEDVVVMAGLAQVKPGDTVKKGQVLISGVVPPAAEQEQSAGGDFAPFPGNRPPVCPRAGHRQGPGLV